MILLFIPTWAYDLVFTYAIAYLGLITILANYFLVKKTIKHGFIYIFAFNRAIWYEYYDLKSTRKKDLELDIFLTDSKPLAPHSQQPFFHHEIHKKSNRTFRAA